MAAKPKKKPNDLLSFDFGFLANTKAKQECDS
jgi:hypothetical protein